MKRINIALTEHQLTWLQKQRKSTGIGISELLRRLVDDARKSLSSYAGHRSADRHVENK